MRPSRVQSGRSARLRHPSGKPEGYPNGRPKDHPYGKPDHYPSGKPETKRVSVKRIIIIKKVN
jgi:hypothetical protein